MRLYSEMVIHGEIYKARPDVNSVCHHHAMAVLPFCATGVELVPLFHLGGTPGGKVPFWDSRDEFGDTNLLVRTPEEGASLARALGLHFMVLLRRHGATLSAGGCANAYSARSTPPTMPNCSCARWRSARPGRSRRARPRKTGGHNMGTRGIERAWEYWSVRLQKAEAMWAASGLPMVTGSWLPRGHARPPPSAPSPRPRACAAQGEGGQAQAASRRVARRS